MFNAFFSTLILLFGLACSTIAPTPILMGRVVDLNNEVVTLYMDCSDGANYTPEKEGCAFDLLTLKVDETMALSLELVSADMDQPHGYDIYLATSMIYFRIGMRNLNEYTRAEQIARQFFEIQKANSGSALNTARFYWPWFASATASKQYFEDRPALDLDRKEELLLAAGEGTLILNVLEGPRLVRLKQALENLQAIVALIESST